MDISNILPIVTPTVTPGISSEIERIIAEQQNKGSK